MAPSDVEFQVNSYTTNSQNYPAVAMNGDGDVVVVWESQQDGSGEGIFGRRYDTAGLPLGIEFQVNVHTVGPQVVPKVAVGAAGDFVVIWTSGGQDGSTLGVFGRRFESSGSPSPTEFQVNTTTIDYEWNPALAADTNGGFVVTWQSSLVGRLRAQRFDGAGSRVGSEIQVSVYTTAAQLFPAIGLSADGDFVIAWHDFGQDGAGLGIFARRFDQSGTPQGVDFRVNSFTPDDQSLPTVAVDTNGRFVVAWQSAGQDGSGNGVFGQRFGATGAFYGGEFRINRFTSAGQTRPSIAVLGAVAGAPESVVAWESDGQDSSSLGIFTARFGDFSYPLFLKELQANQSTVNAQHRPSLASDGHGRYIVVWESLGQDGSETGIFAQRFAKLPPAGSEFQVNAQTSAHQTRATAAMSPDGDFVVVWQSQYRDDSVYGVAARRFDPAGNPKGGEFLVNSFTADFQGHPVVASDGDGDFVVIWDGLSQDGSGRGVFGRRFGSDGSARGTEFQVNSYTAGDQEWPAVGMAPDGRFAVAWESGDHQDGESVGVFARRYDAAGVPQLAEFQVNVQTGGPQTYPSVAMRSDGRFVVAWQHRAGDWEIFARRFDPAGIALGGEIAVDTLQIEDNERPRVATTPGGDFVIVWNHEPAFGAPSVPRARRFNSAGTPLATDFAVYLSTGPAEARAAVAVDTDGDFLVAWAGVYARAFNRGALGGDQFDVNFVIENDQRFPTVSGDGLGRFVIVWESGGQDGDGYGIFARLIATSTAVTLDVDGDGDALPLTDGRLILRYLFGFRGAVLIVGEAVGEDCTICEAEEIEDRIASILAVLDVDADGDVRPLSDGILIFRYLFGVRGTPLIAGAVSSTCTRCTFEAIEEHIAGLLP